MLQKALTLTNEAGKAFINSWILNFSADGKADIIAVFTPAEPSNFFYAVVKAEKRPEPYSISLPFAGTNCLPTFFGSLDHLKKIHGFTM